jgi:hypothetical protein
MSTLERINNAASINKHWSELNNKVYALCDKLDNNSGRVGSEEQALVGEIGNLTRTILQLKDSQYFNSVQYLKTFDGTNVYAESAITAGILMLKDLENTTGCDFQINPVRKINAVKATAVASTLKSSTRGRIKRPLDFGCILRIMASIGFALYFFYLALLGFINGFSGLIDLTLGLILGVICLGVSLTSGAFAYMFISEKQ